MALSPSQVPILIIAQDPVIYNTVAASAFFFWDYCITLGDEVELIWGSRFNLGSLIFCIIRYLTLCIRIVELMFYTNLSGLIHPSTMTCKAWLWLEIIPGHVLFTCVEVLLITRVYAFYERSKYVLAGLVALFILEHAGSITILARGVGVFEIMPNPLSPSLHIGSCISVRIPKDFSNYWLPGLGFESILFVLLAIKFIQTKHAEINSPHVVIVFVRDGAWAFVGLFGVLLWSCLAFELAPEKGDIALTWLYSVMGFCGSRLILNLRLASQERRRSQSMHSAIDLHTLGLISLHDCEVVMSERNIA